MSQTPKEIAEGLVQRIYDLMQESAENPPPAYADEHSPRTLPPVAWPFDWLVETIAKAQDDIVQQQPSALFNENRIMRDFLERYPRATKLMNKDVEFLVVAEHEPYYIQIYEIIRDHENRKGTWTLEDEEIFRRQKAAKSAGLLDT